MNRIGNGAPCPRHRSLRAELALTVLAAFVGIASSAPANAEPWSSVLDPSRAIDWSAAGVVGPIPARETLCSTLNPGVNAGEINAAIADCPSEQTVYLSAGTYNLSSGINFQGKSGVTLRGAGADLTRINFLGTTSCSGVPVGLCIASPSYAAPWGPPNMSEWTAGFSKGSTTVTLNNTSNLSVGSLLILNQLNDAADNGGVFTCSATPDCSYGSYGGGGSPGDREQLEHVVVQSIAGNEVTIAPAISMPNWRSAQSPQAWWAGGVPTTASGIEDLEVNFSGGNAGIMLQYVANVWVKGVKSVNAPRNHIWIWQGAHVTVRDSYFEESQSHATQSYGVEIIMGSHNLIENNIFHRVTAPLMVSGAATGTVFGYNFSSDDTYFNATWMQPSSYFHAAGTGYVLHESNQGAGLISDQVHGPSFLVTAFRNRWDGWEPEKTAQTIPVHIYSLSRYFNLIANVLGTPGYHSKYESFPGSATDCYTSVYALGFGGNCYDGGGSNPPNDSLVRDTLMRWGNYDVVTAAPRFEASEVPSAIAPFANFVPLDQILPASFYQLTKPRWWGAMPWPAVGPEVTTGDIAGTGGYAWRIPARVCYENADKDASGMIVDFNAATCYGSGAEPPRVSAPTDLRIK